MARFYVNKYPLLNVVLMQDGEHQKPQDIPAGTIFSIVGMDGYNFFLQPVRKSKDLNRLIVAAPMLDIGYTESEFTD